MSKLGAHIVQGSRNGYGQLCEAKPAVVLSNGDGGALLEAWQKSGNHTYTIYRHTLYKDAPQGIDQMTPAQARALADSVYPTLKAKWNQNPADFYTVLNEPAANNASIMPTYIAYELRMMELAEADGLKLCILNLAGGTPGDLNVWKSIYVPHIRRAFEKGHIYGRHCYGGAKLSVPDGNTNRAFIEAEYLRSIGLNGGIVITEAGRNGGYGYPGDADFIADVQAYNAQMMQHSNIIGACLWTLGEWDPPSSNWQTAIPTLAPWMVANPTPKWTPAPVPPTTPPVNYKVVAHLTPPTLTRAEYDQIGNEAFPAKQGILFSADDVARLVAPGLPGSKVIAWWPNRWTDDIVAWLKSKGVQTVETRPQTPPPPSFRLASPVVGIPLYVTDRFNSPRSYSPPYHEGLDLRATNSNGQAVKIVAGSSGVIDGIRRTDPGSGYGLYVRIKTVVGSVTYTVWYCHLSAIPASLVVGQSVVGGQEIGTAGSTGNSTGIHLHITVQKVPGGLSGYIVPNVIDPAPLLGLPASTLPGPGQIPPPQPSGNARMGLHADADGRMPAADYKEFTDLTPGVIKVLSSHSFEAINRLANEHPTATFIVRAFLSFWQNGQPRNISPAQFVTDTINDVRRAVDAIAAAGKGQAVWVELHNEPNLIQEGLGGAWSNGTTFGVWLTDVLTRYDQALPQVKYLFPGLSPGPTVPGVRQDSTQFMGQCLNAAALCDGLGIHAYWNHLDAPLSTALAVVDGYLTQVPTLPVWVTEASSNKGATAESMATDYVTFWREMKKLPRVQGVTYYVCSASDPAFANETWTPRGLGAKVRGKM